MQTEAAEMPHKHVYKRADGRPPPPVIFSLFFLLLPLDVTRLTWENDRRKGLKQSTLVIIQLSPHHV